MSCRRSLGLMSGLLLQQDCLVAGDTGAQGAACLHPRWAGGSPWRLCRKSVRYIAADSLI